MHEITTVTSGSRRAFTARLLLISALMIIAAVSIYIFSQNNSRQTYLKEFQLTRQDGSAFTENDLLGNWSIVFLGYMNCPDVCPATLQQLKVFYTQIKEKEGFAELPQVIFVSVDGERDKPELIADYVNYFDKDFIGATGTSEQIDNFTRKLDAFYRINKQKGEHYDVVHTADIFVINPEAQLVDRISPPLDIKMLVTEFLGHAKQQTTLAVNNPYMVSGYGIK